MFFRVDVWHMNIFRIHCRPWTWLRHKTHKYRRNKAVKDCQKQHSYYNKHTHIHKKWPKAFSSSFLSNVLLSWFSFFFPSFFPIVKCQRSMCTYIFWLVLLLLLFGSFEWVSIHAKLHGQNANVRLSYMYNYPYIYTYWNRFVSIPSCTDTANEESSFAESSWKAVLLYSFSFSGYCYWFNMLAQTEIRMNGNNRKRSSLFSGSRLSFKKRKK